MNAHPIAWCLLLGLAAVASAAQAQANPPKPAHKGPPAPQAAQAASAPANGGAVGAGTLSKKYCCSSPSGKACYVFGNASCNLCNTFCNGQIVIQ